MTDDEDSTTTLSGRGWWRGRLEPEEIRRRWEALPADPDPNDDLGYRMVELDVLTTGNSEPQTIMLPSDEDMLLDDMFVVVDDASVCELIDWT